ncbi:MAG: methyltransferase domain-containing protein [Syntrophales bacterium]|jgi:ubiquinone/menaquinone biosynthesis C-methylase UbiE
MTREKAIFDEWPEKYDQWFTTPIGYLVRKYESELILDFLKPAPAEMILDAGCGTGVFTRDIISSGSQVIGLDISFPMLRRAREKSGGVRFHPIWGDISTLPFREESFDKIVSVTALEFIADAKSSVAELFRVAKRGGVVVVATLNSRSPWAARRKEEARKGHAIFSKAVLRSPDDLLALSPAHGVARTAIHFDKEDSPEKAVELECEGQAMGSMTGAFAAVLWLKP